MIGLILLHIFYASPKELPSVVKIFLLLAIAAIPLLGMQSMYLAAFLAIGLGTNAITTIVLVWLVYGIIPDRRQKITAASKKPMPAQSKNKRFKTALISTSVVFPVFLLFSFYLKTDALLILIYIMLLTGQPGFAKSFKAGGAMLVANVVGGLIAILSYELLVIVRMFPYLLLLVLLWGLILGEKLFSDRPAASLYGTAFSTFLVIIGMTTNTEAEADTKVYTRIFQTFIAVVYIVTASGFVTALVESFSGRKTPAKS